MAEEFEDRTEAPTPRRREEAREQGQVARSSDLTSAAMLLGFLGLLSAFGGRLIGTMRTLTERALSAESLGAAGPSALGQGTTRLMGAVGMALLPILLGAMVLAIVVNVAQTGFLMTSKRLQPNFGVLNPLQGFSRIFARDGLAHLVLNLLKMGLVLAVAYSAVYGRMAGILALPRLEYVQAFGLGASLTLSIALRVGTLLLVLAALDYAYERYRHEQRLRMTKQEIKEELRHMEGDPKIKQRRRSLALQMIKKRLKHDVPTADVIVTNPTHFAVALKYDSTTMHAPRVVAKGQDFLAQRIREIGLEAGVPIVERPPLARALYKACEVGQEIPEQFYSAVAEILAYVYELTGKAKRKATAA